MVSWEELAGRALARQFPEVGGRDEEAVEETLARTGPIQSQTARSPFLALAARMPGVTRETIAAAYDAHRIVRGSTLRGTVHTSAAPDHPLLEAATRIGQRALWERTLELRQTSLEEVWRELEEFAHDTWRSPAELSAHLAAWLAEHDPGAGSRLEGQAGRFFGFGHGGLLRRPLKGGWHAQGAPGYRSAAAVLGDHAERCALVNDRDAALDQLVRRHLGAHGPASRHDLAWWSGVGLRPVDAALERLADALVTEPGPDGRDYHDLRDPAPSEGARVPSGVRLLPEFDALLCAYDPPGRARFVTAEHYDLLWSRANGLVLAPLLVDGRLTGHWRIPGSGVRRPCEVTWFAGTRQPRRSELDEAVAAVESAYGVTVTDLSLTRG